MSQYSDPEVKPSDIHLDEKYDPTAHEVPASLTGLSDGELEAVHKRTLRKIDIMVMPSITLMYILNYLDRQNISAAKLANITKDLKLTAVDYQMCISFLFVGYILFQVPSNMIAGKISRPAQYICAGMAVWGVVSAATAAVENFTGIIVCRTILGVTESVFFPGALYYLSTFYTRKQMAARVALLYSGSQLGNAFGGLFAILILKLDGKHGIQGWRWLFIIEGAATVGIATALAFQLPNNPATAPWLTVQERDSLVYGLAVDMGAKDDRKEISTLSALKMVLTDPKTYLLMGVLYCSYIAAAVTSFFPSVVGTLGYSRNITYLLTAPPYLLTCVCMLINGWHSDKHQERFWHIVLPLCLAIVANAIALGTLNTGARYLAMMFMPTTLYSSSIVTLSWITGTLTQPAIKRALAIGVINAACNTPNVWTPFIYTGAPHYTHAFAMNLAAAAVAIGFAFATKAYLKAKNEELDRGDISARGAPTAAQVAHGFRYTL